MPNGGSGGYGGPPPGGAPYGGGGGYYHGGFQNGGQPHHHNVPADTSTNPDAAQTPTLTPHIRTNPKVPALFYYLVGWQRVKAFSQKITVAIEKSHQDQNPSQDHSTQTTGQNRQEDHTMSRRNHPTPPPVADSTPTTSRYTPTPQARAIVQAIATLAAIQGIFMIFANIAANRIWQIRNIPLDGGIFLLLVVSAAEDIINELFGRENADYIVKWCAIGSFLGSIAIQVIEHLPTYIPANNINLGIALGMVTRTNIASAVAFYAGGRANNFIYELSRSSLGGDRYMSHRFVLSTIIGQIVDSLIFSFWSFGGRYGAGTVFKQMIVGYIAYIILKAITTRLFAVPIAKHIRRRIDSV